MQCLKNSSFGSQECVNFIILLAIKINIRRVILCYSGSASTRSVTPDGPFGETNYLTMSPISKGNSLVMFQFPLFKFHT